MFAVIDKMLATGQAMVVVVMKESDGRLRVSARPHGETDNAVLGQGVSVVASAGELDDGYADVLGKYAQEAKALADQVAERIEAVKAAAEDEKKAKADAVKKLGSKKPQQGVKATVKEQLSESGGDPGEGGEKSGSAGDAASGAKVDDGATLDLW